MAAKVHPRNPDELAITREAARAMVLYAETAVEKKMKAVMQVDQRLSVLRSMKVPAAERALQGLSKDRKQLDDEVRGLVELAGRCNALADRVEALLAAGAGPDPEEAAALEANLRRLEQDVLEARASADRARAESFELQRSREEVSQRAGDLLSQLAASENQLVERDARIASLEQKVVQLELQVQAEKQAAAAAGVDLPAPVGEADVPGAFRGNPLIAATDRLADEKYAGRASVRLRELLVEEPHRLDDLVDLAGLPRHEVIDCLESFVALGVARIVEDA